MARTNAYTREKIIEAIYKGRGKTSIIAHLLGCTPNTVLNYVKRYRTVAKALDEAREDFSSGLVDKAEVKLEAAVMDGQPWAVKYALSTQGKARGYTERVETTGADGGPVQVIAIGGINPDEDI